MDHNASGDEVVSEQGMGGDIWGMPCTTLPLLPSSPQGGEDCSSEPEDLGKTITRIEYKGKGRIWRGVKEERRLT